MQRMLHIRFSHDLSGRSCWLHIRLANISSILLSILLLTTMQTYPATAKRTERIATNDTDNHRLPCFFIVQSGRWKEVARCIKPQIRIYVKDVAALPVKHSLYFHESKHLGVLGFTVDVLKYEDAKRIWDRFAFYLDNYGPVPRYEPFKFPARSDPSRSVKVKRKISAFAEHGVGFVNEKPRIDGPFIEEKSIRRLIKRLDAPPPRGSIEVYDFPPVVVRKVLKGDHGLITLAMQPEVKYSRMAGRFSQYEHSGRGTVVYHFDAGCDLNHPELRRARVKGWIYSGPNPSNSEFDAEPWGPLSVDNTLHGTAVLGKIVGKETGIAQEAEVIVVKLVEAHGLATVMSSIDGFIRAYDHIMAYNRHRKGVILSTTLGWDIEMLDYITRKPKFRSAIDKLFKNILKRIEDIGNTVIVVSAGNKQGVKRIDSIPAISGKGLVRFVIVAGHDSEGDVYHRENRWNNPPAMNVFQYGSKVRISAPAVGVITAGRDPRSGEYIYHRRDGTSFAAPAVAGMISMWISAGVPVANVVEYMYGETNVKTSAGIGILFNSIPIESWP